MRKKLGKIICYELLRQCKRKSNLILFLLIGFEVLVVEGIYSYIWGPIGIWHELPENSKGFKMLVDLFYMVPYSTEEINFLFWKEASETINMGGQLARSYLDKLGALYYLPSFLVGAFAISEKQQKKDREQ